MIPDAAGRALAAAIEPVVGSVYFAKEAHDAFNALGHGHPAVQAAIKRQASRLIHVSNLFFPEYQAELARRLTEISGLDRAFLLTTREAG